MPRADAARILSALGFGVGQADDGLDVTVPHWRRADVTREADLVEEVARLWGLDRLPSTLPARRGAVGRLAPAQRLRRRAEDALVGAGLSEAVGWSFAAPDLADRLGFAGDDPRAHPIGLENPMSEDQSVMRTTLLGSLLDALHRNRTRGFDDVRLFEYGAIYLAAGDAAAADGQPLVPGARPGAARRAGAAGRAAHRPDAPAELERARAAAGRLLRGQGRARGADARAAGAVRGRAARAPSRSCTRAAAPR